MKKKQKILVIITLSAFALSGIFLVGAYAYRAGFYAKFKALLVEPPPPPPPPAEVSIDFNLLLLEDPVTAALNGQKLPDNQTPLSFLVAGHTYGRPGDNNPHPAQSLVSNLAELTELEPDFFILLGDIVWKPSAANFDQVEDLVLDQFNVPVFNAVGNHDVTKRDLYNSRYGNTIFAFQHKQQLFIILDTTLKYAELTSDQYDFILKLIQDHGDNIQAVHIFMHHVLFLDQDQIHDKSLLKPNEGDGSSIEFLTFIEDEIIPISEIMPVYIYAGDVGAIQGGNLSPLYIKHPDQPIFFLATGLGDYPEDSVIFVEGLENGQMLFTPIPLGGQSMDSIENYSFSNWLKK
jgi:hypothetical protein